MSEEQYVSWEQVTRGCTAFVVNCNETLKDIDVVVGISDDMVIPTIVSNLLKVPVVPVINTNILGNDINNFVSITNPLLSGQGKLPPQPKLLVVASKTGIDNNIEVIVETYKQRGHDVTLFTLFHCSDLGIPPDEYWHRVNECNSKLIFPWEI